MKYNLIALIMTFFIYGQGIAQSNDPVLFTVADQPVHLSEFEYIYTKTNGKKADFSEASLQEYLDLYVKFKLKVMRAREMQLDTIPNLIQELAGYRKQLADSYLIDREVTDKLIKEAYDRTQKDVDISHIMIACGVDAKPADTLIAYNKAKEALSKLNSNSSWEEIAMAYSDDNSKKQNKGHVGFITALFPKGFYALESAAYALKKGQTSGVIRTTAGYHLIRVNEIREARGEVEAAHILLRVKQGEDGKKEQKTIDSLYQIISKGVMSFDEMAKKHSQDKVSAEKGGYIGFFGINRYERAFEDAAFGIEKDGAICKPIRTAVGWHIIKRVSKKGIEPFNISRVRLQRKVKADPRFDLAREVMIERIKEDNKFKEWPKNLSKFTNSLDSNFLSFKWKADNVKDKTSPLFAIGKDTKLNTGQFAEYLGRATRKRIRMAGSTSIEDAVNQLYADFIDEECLRYEEQHLEEKYPDFKALMREYEEGILLFEATKMEVWDKASQDSAGLAEFFKTIDGKYKWAQRCEVSMYSLKKNGKDKIDEVRKFAAKNDSDKTLAKFNEGGITTLTVQNRTFERNRNAVLEKMNWKVGELSPNETNSRDNSLNFMKIEKVLPPGSKTLEDARGYVVADYQDKLEYEWVKNLKQRYKVDIKKNVFRNMIKK